MINHLFETPAQLKRYEQRKARIERIRHLRGRLTVQRDCAVEVSDPRKDPPGLEKLACIVRIRTGLNQSIRGRGGAGSIKASRTIRVGNAQTTRHGLSRRIGSQRQQ